MLVFLPASLTLSCFPALFGPSCFYLCRMFPIVDILLACSVVAKQRREVLFPVPSYSHRIYFSADVLIDMTLACALPSPCTFIGKRNFVSFWVTMFSKSRSTPQGLPLALTAPSHALSHLGQLVGDHIIFELQINATRASSSIPCDITRPFSSRTTSSQIPPIAQMGGPSGPQTK